MSLRTANSSTASWGREERDMSITDMHSKKGDKDKLQCNRVYRRDDVFC